MEVDTRNHHLVGAHGDGIVILNPMMRLPLTKEMALNLAAWIVAIVGDDEKFNKILEAIKNT